MDVCKHSDKQAIDRLRRGDLGGLETLVRNYQLRAIRAAWLISGDTQLAEDIVQTAFLRAAERIQQFDASRPFEPWFLRSVVNDAIKAAKRQKRQVSLEVGDESTLLEWLTDPAPLPEALAQAAETRQAVQRALEQLAPQQRAAIVMRYYLEMDEAEMSRELNSPVGTIKWRLHAARQRLHRLLGPLAPVEEIATHHPAEQSADRE
ncbi:MAG: sigma-70 family RNA polymerase sigma factor [Anaerolineales bacterium]|nr:sigma-70 family RNA polymerase sigma factor [Anaerolineales bacterium]